MFPEFFWTLGYVGRVEPPTKFSKRGGLTGSQFLEGGCWERECEFFSGLIAVFT